MKRPATWQLVAQGKSSAAHKGMVHAAQAMAATAIAALTNPALIAEVKADLVAHGGRYASPLPEDVGPPLDMPRGRRGS